MAEQGLFAQQRRTLILEHVRRNGAVRVADLVERLGVSDMTIRRDLEALAREGSIEKVHGGAVAAPTTSEEPGFEAKTERESSAKAAIAEAAAAMVRPGDVVGLSAGTTTYAVAQRLLAVPRLTVVTNSLPIAGLLSNTSREGGFDAPGLLLVGGAPTRSAALVGPIADEAIKSLHVDLLFLGAHGVSAGAGLTTPNLAEGHTNRALLASSRRAVVVADHSKWGVVGFSGFAALEEVDGFVTDDLLPDEARTVIKERAGRLVIAGGPKNG